MSTPATALPTLSENQVYYFAYGSNMNPKVLTGMRSVICHASVPARADGWVLGFNLSAMPYIEPGMGTIERVTPSMKTAAAAMAAPPGTAPVTAQQAYAARVAAGLHGVVHLISAEDWQQVKRTEGVRLKGIMYQPIEIPVITYNGQQVTAWTLQSSWISSGDVTAYLPAPRYINAIREGAKVSGMDPAYCRMLDEHPAYERLTGWKGTLTWYIIAAICFACFLLLTPACAVSYMYNKISGTGPGIKPLYNNNNKNNKDGNQGSAAPDSTVTMTADSTGTAPPAPAPPPSAAQSAAKAHEPPPLSSIIRWMAFKTDGRIVALYFLSHQLACRAAHHLVLKRVFGSGINNDDSMIRGTVPAPLGTKKDS